MYRETDINDIKTDASVFLFSHITKILPMLICALE